MMNFATKHANTMEKIYRSQKPAKAKKYHKDAASSLQRAWDALQSVPSYVEAQAQAFAAEPEPEVPLSERGQLNGDRTFRLLR
jgi:hypothetical protein